MEEDQSERLILDMPENTFTGPLFVVGIPRSGTKLLRDLLNQSPQIFIPESESHFIPHLTEHFGDPPDLNDPEELDLFLNQFSKHNFFRQMKDRGAVISKADLAAVSGKPSWESLFETIFRFYSFAGDDRSTIWGDKTPSYMNNTSLLKKLFPSAKFVHIIRDPRDCSVSARQAWGKSVYRAAEEWRKGIERLRKDRDSSDGDCLEVRYEDLLTCPEDVMRRICGFVGCDYEPGMIRLTNPSENLGDAKGKTEVIKSNQNKYRTKLTPREIRRIEEIVQPVLKTTEYESDDDIDYRPLSSVERMVLTAYDGLASITFHIRERGFVGGLRYFYGFHGYTTWAAKYLNPGFLRKT